jgi:hypothetical protein
MPQMRRGLGSVVNSRHLALALVGWYLVTPVTAHGQRQGCDQQAGMRAEAEADTLKTWQAIHDSFLRYRLCDDGAVAEGYSDSVDVMLAERWDQLSALQSLIDKDSSFRQFVFSHIDATASAKNTEIILNNTKHRCPDGLARLCSDIQRRELEAKPG